MSSLTILSILLFISAYECCHTTPNPGGKARTTRKPGGLPPPGRPTRPGGRYGLDYKRMRGKEIDFSRIWNKMDPGKKYPGNFQRTGRKGLDYQRMGRKGLDFQGMGKKRLDFQRMGRKGLDFQRMGKKGLDYKRIGRKGLDFQRMGKKGLDFQSTGKKGLDFQSTGKKGLDFQTTVKKGLDYRRMVNGDYPDGADYGK